MRLVTQLGSERSERIRSQERADIAAHLHDSVLQTLALIQRNAGSPREVARLARGQERELRTLLYGSRTATGQLGDQLRRAAGEVEDDYAVTIDIVVVGDAELTDGLAALVAAAREAMVNAAKHSQTTSISLYAEVEDETVHVFVKDRGVGFDVATIGEDRQGVRGSIVARLERHGGSATIVASPGAGTEVRMEMPK
jgi:signal transduction histidine kinase